MNERRRLLLSSGKKDYSTEYFTLTALTSGTFTFNKPRFPSGGPYFSGCSYSLDNGVTWVTRALSTTTAQTITTPTIQAGDKVLWKMIASSLSTASYNCNFSSTAKFDVSGNIMSLLKSDNFIGQTIDSNSSFYKLFYNNKNIVNAENLVLPLNVTENCYYYMFGFCTSLTTAPELPATTLANYCYNYMFSGCTSLTSAPELPATTLANYCYNYMFSGCTSLTTAPQLPATTLATCCYNGMFNSCKSLTTVHKLPATTLDYSCYNGMFYGCTSLTIIPSDLLPATTLTNSCYESMFSGCTSLTSAPDLPATTLANDCYSRMFSGCTSLAYITCLATNISASYCTTNWVLEVSPTGTFVKASSMSGWTTGGSGIPSGWTVQDA